MASNTTPTPTEGEDCDTKSLMQAMDSNPTIQQQGHEEEPQQQTPESPDKILTLETPDPGSAENLEEPTDSQVQQPQQQEQQLSPQELHSEQDIEPGSPSSVPVTDQNVTIVSLRGGGVGRRKKTKQKQREGKKSQKKLQVLVENLKPIPFVPVKTLDFARHEDLLMRLGLWDFVHLEFDKNVRSDLIAQLIATYNPAQRCAYVNDTRIKVNRADLGRALKLPVKKERVQDNPPEVQESEESIGFIEEFLFTCVLLHEDTWMMPTEVLNWTKFIKERQLGKVDWAGLFWFMVEKELMAAPMLGKCYYASHFQCLIKHQKEELLRDDSIGKLEVKEVKEEEEEEDASGDLKMVGESDDHGEKPEFEEHNIELSLGQDNTMKEDVEGEHVAVADEDAMDIDEDKEEDNGRWFFPEKLDVRENFLKRCNLGDFGGVEETEGRKREEEEEEEGVEEEEGAEEEVHGEEDIEEDQDERLHLSLNADTLDRPGSENMIGEMEASQNHFTSEMQLHGSLSGEFLGSREHIHSIPGSSSMLGNNNKRMDIGHDIDMSHHSLDVSNKRLRTETEWDDKPLDFDACMDQVQSWIAKGRMLYASKEQACGSSMVNQQILLEELQRRNNMVEQLHKSRMDDQRKRSLEIYRLEHELHMMTNLVQGYRSALKETQKAFAEYRERYVLAEEPLYKDVKGSGGLVLSTTELDKLLLKKEEEERMERVLLQQEINDFEVRWLQKFEAHTDGVSLLGLRLSEVEKEVNIMRDLNAKRGISKTALGSECDAPECDAPKCDAPKCDAPECDAPACDAPACDAPACDAPASDAPASDAPASDAPMEA